MLEAVSGARSGFGVTVIEDPSSQPSDTEKLLSRRAPDFSAGVSDQVRLVDASRFRKEDKKRLNSCVLVSATFELPTGNGQTQTAPITVCAAALPYAEHCYAAPGTLAVSLPQGGVRQTASLNALMSNNYFVSAKRSIASGDYPSDKGSSLVSAQQDGQPQTCSVAASVGRAFFDWLRTTNGRPRLEGVIRAMNQPFQSDECITQTDLVVSYSVNPEGEVVVKTIRNGGFQVCVVADKQAYDIATNVVMTNKGMLNINVRDQVANAGVEATAKHGGQPLPSQLPAQYDDFLSLEDQQRIENSSSSKQHKLRKSYCQGGLAVAIQFYFSTPG